MQAGICGQQPPDSEGGARGQGWLLSIRLPCIMCYILQPDWSLVLLLNTQNTETSLTTSHGICMKQSLQLPVSIWKTTPTCCYYRNKGEVEKTLAHPTYYEIRPQVSISMCN